MLALATLSRIGAVLAGVPKREEFTMLLTWAPVTCWLTGALVVGALMLRARPASAGAR